MNRFVNLSVLSLFCCAAVTLVGCGSAEYPGPQRYPVSGTVTINGKPIEEGNITFRSSEEKGRSSSGAIENGKYSIEEKQGPIAGQYKVEILGYEEIGEVKDEDMGAATRQIVPVQFNESSSLTATLPSDSGNEFDFDLKP
ncbi:hypothetical protein UC8_43930 [Roseimaritima ulvae]|uniref:Carboxypeptidase regulatory-like domain-containing protein n=2 Tax=Roseimaritima ulvae TaxID=980254 RepID=A0A5B9QWS4_9BACT|nr:hypothetical protein UC8_43930 [Roseimaritima ulvae]